MSAPETEIPGAEIEVLGPSAAPAVPLARIAVWYGRADLWVYRDDRGHIRTVMPVRGLPQPLPEKLWHGLPPLGPLLASRGV